MALETGTYISELNVANPATADDMVDGDNHIRLLKSTIKATFPNITGAVTPTHTELNFVDGVTSAIQTQLNLKSTLASPTFTGVPAAPTAAAATSTTQLATTAFVTTADNLKANLASPTLTGVPAAPTAAALTSTTQLATTAFVTTADNLKANLASPTFTGTPAAPTAAAATNTTQLATTAFVTAAIAASPGLIAGTAQASTSGTSINFTGIPAGINRVDIMLSGVSTNGTSLLQIQIGDGSIEVTGYEGTTFSASASSVASSALSAGFVIANDNIASNTWHGKLSLALVDGTTWVATGTFGRVGTVYFGSVAGSKTLTGVLDRVRITTVGGTDAFDAGIINISAE